MELAGCFLLLLEETVANWVAAGKQQVVVAGRIDHPTFGFRLGHLDLFA